MVMFRSHGITKDPEKMSNPEVGPGTRKCSFWAIIIITDIQCALGLSQLNKLDRFIKRRQEIVDRYNKAFENNPVVKIPPMVRTPYHHGTFIYSDCKIATIKRSSGVSE